MDQIKIGKFIASCRKELGMTQANLAEKLGISDRAISKWETGKSMPDSGLMLELCDLLKINVNELLSGERIMTEAYDKRAEANLLAMRQEVEKKNRQMLRMEYWLSGSDCWVGHGVSGGIHRDTGLATNFTHRVCTRDYPYGCLDRRGD